MAGLAARPVSPGMPHLRGAGPRLVVLLVAVVAVAAQIAGPAWSLGVGIAFFALGLAHGAAEESGDTIHLPLPATIAGYLLAAAAFLALWMSAPLSALALFLVLSAWHFALADKRHVTPSSLAFGILAVAGPAAGRPLETRRIFETMTQLPMPDWFIPALAAVALLAVMLGAFDAWRSRKSLRALPIALCAAACVLLHPVLAVGAMFLCGHVLPVQSSQIARFGWRRILTVQAPVAMLSLAGLGLLFWLSNLAGFGSEVMAGIALALAMPHMLADGLDRQVDENAGKSASN